MENIQSQFFKSLRVVEISTVLAGPLTARFFAECGATVIKVEPPPGDVTRSWKTSNETNEVSSYFASANAGKQYMRLDLKSAEGRKKLDELLADADVFISNLLPSSAAKLKLAPEDLRTNYPHLVAGIIEGYGNGSSRPAYDIVLQAETGFLSLTGTGSVAAKLPVAFIDLLASHQLRESLLMGLMHKQRSGNGSVSTVSLFDVAIGSLGNQAGDYLMSGNVPGRLGTLHPGISPYGDCFTCSDGRQIVLAVGSNEQFHQLCELCGKAELAAQEQFADNQARVKHRVLLHETLQPAFSVRPSGEWDELLQNHRVPAGIIKNLKEVLHSEAAQADILHEKIDGFNVSSVKTVNLKLFS
ncbi:MAG: CoA transferase [Bacteroidetes bacterium]|nr:CoA transferase [Bacteroidota bacterium]